MKNRITELLDITYPIIQAGMVWNSGWELASAVSNAGGLGIIGSGSMYPEQLIENIEKCKAATNKPYAVNVPLLYPDVEEHMANIIKYKVPIVFTSAGSPKTWTSILQKEGIIVVHVVSSAKFALKSQEAGVDAIVAEGFEAGGHNGREETTTLCLIPIVKKAISIPLIAAGGIATGSAMMACMALGADGVQIGSRFAASVEGTGHQNFKEGIVDAKEGDTELVMKKYVPVRLIKNAFYDRIKEIENNGGSKEEIAEALGRGRAKRGMLEGDMVEGELEIGQISGLIDDIKPAAELVKEIWNEFIDLKKEISKW